MILAAELDLEGLLLYFSMYNKYTELLFFASQ